jgi:predicted HTH transcriptional regulator
LATSDGHDVVPTVAGLLLFGRDERVGELLPRAAVTATRFSGESPQSPVIERVKITGSLLSIYETLMRFVSRYCDLHEQRPRNLPETVDTESPVPARANYHRGVVSEAIANMLAHRDLALRDLPSRVHVFDHSLEFVNSRRSVGFSPVAQKAIRYGMPQRLNPQLAAALTSDAYGLKLPLRGLPALLRETKRFSNRKAEIVSFNDEFRLRVYGV